MSTNVSPLETLRQCRPLLLAMETIGWFHMTGKARVEFLKQHGGEKGNYGYEKWHDFESPPFPWDTLLEWTKRLDSTLIPNRAWPDSFKEFTERHRQQRCGLLGLLQAAHGIVSGIEKNLPSETSKYLNQTVLHMWLSSPWGSPKRNLLADPPEILTPRGWRQLVTEIRRVLEELRDLGTKGVQEVSFWKQWREQAIGESSFIRRAFLSTLAETRLPNNEVTLWDQSYVAAALFKSAVAGALLDSSHPWDDERIKGRTRWRLVTVAIGTDHYEARSVKIGDWSGAWGAIQDFFNRVAELVEVDLAIGSLLYRDDSVAVFSFPGDRFDEEEAKRNQQNDPNFQYSEVSFAPWLVGFKDWLQDEVEAIAQGLSLETPPLVRLSAPTRSLVPMVKEYKGAKKQLAVPLHKRWDVRWNMPPEARGHVCPVCGLRLNGDPTSKTRPCRVCWERRHHRRDDWVQGHLGHDTIWFEEVADRNGRLALLTLSLDVEPWLNGERVDSLRAQSVCDYVRFNPELTRLGYSLHPFDLLRNYITNKVGKDFDGKDPVLTKLQEGYRNESSWESFFFKIVEDRADAPGWDSLNDDQRGAWLTHQLFVKLSSPGRVYRFWREAEDFFHDLLREFRQIASRSENPWRVRRLVLVPKDKNGWKDLTLYDGRWRGSQLSLIYVQSLGGFVTASNLARLLQADEAREAFMKGPSIPLEEEDQFGRSKEMVVESVGELDERYPHLGVYAPLIPLEISPLRFRVIVPLESASECVDLALNQWKEYFARVWDRLPLRVGIIAFPRTLPYQAVVEAARNVEDALSQTEPGFWRVDKCEKRRGIVALHLRCGSQSVLRMVPITMPDGREDVFYPYVEVEDRQLRFPKDFRHPDGRIFRHVSDLRVGDGIKVAPAGALTLFMGSTAARFQVEAPRLLDEWSRMREIWQLLTRVAPSQTALQQLQSDLIQVERSWRNHDGTWAAPDDLRRDTYRALLAHHLDRPPQIAWESLTQAAMEGLLMWALDWHLTVLKESQEA